MHSETQIIDSVTVPGSAGRIGMVAAPGSALQWRRGPAADAGAEGDLRRIRGWGAEALVSLVESHELDALGVPDLGARAAALGLWWRHLPIRDVSVPDRRFEERWARDALRLRGILGGGGRVVLHCWAGMGRTGTVAARLLVEFGVPPEAAIERVRTARPGTIQTYEQEAYVRGLRPPPAAPP